MSDLSSILGEPVSLPTEAPAPPPEAPAPVEAPAPAEPPEPAAPAPAPTAEQPRDENGRFVPIQALHEARERNRELAARIAAFERSQAPPPPAAPAFDQDPAGHLKHNVDQIAQRLQSQDQERQAQAIIQRLNHAVTSDEEAFAAQTPDYREAVIYMGAARVRELEAGGMDPQSAQNRATRELHEFAFTTAANGGSPARVAYNIARAKGYTPKAAAQAAPAPVPAAERFNTQQQGAAAARSLGSGSTPGGSPSLQALAAMSDDEFAEATKGAKWAKLMG